MIYDIPKKTIGDLHRTLNKKPTDAVSKAIARKKKSMTYTKKRSNGYSMTVRGGRPQSQADRIYEKDRAAGL